MKRRWVLALLLLPLIAGATPDETDPARVLSKSDYEIYLSTLKTCAPGDMKSVVRTGINPEIIRSGAINLMQITLMNQQSSAERWQSRLLSPETYRLRHSDGFWIALAACYGERSHAQQVLIKNMIDAGHLASETFGTLGAIFSVGKIASAGMWVRSTYPGLVRYSTYVGANLAMYRIYKLILNEYFRAPTAEETKLIESTESTMFANVDVTLFKIKTLSEEKIRRINLELTSPELDSLHKLALEKQRAGLLKHLQSLSEIH